MQSDIINKITELGILARSVRSESLDEAKKALLNIPKKQRAVLSDLLTKATKGEVTQEEIIKITKKQQLDANTELQQR